VFEATGEYPSLNDDTYDWRKAWASEKGEPIKTEEGFIVNPRFRMQGHPTLQNRTFSYETVLDLGPTSASTDAFQQMSIKHFLYFDAYVNTERSLDSLNLDNATAWMNSENYMIIPESGIFQMLGPSAGDSSSSSSLFTIPTEEGTGNYISLTDLFISTTGMRQPKEDN
jgi:hypothetical protein